MSIFALFILLLASYANSESASGILSGIAESLNSKVHQNQKNAFIALFWSQRQSSEVTSLASGQLFSNPTARKSFRVSAMPGARYADGGVVGKLRMGIYDPDSHQTRSYTFQVNVKHLPSRPSWSISSIRRVSAIHRKTLTPPIRNINRKSINKIKNNDRWMYYIY